MEGPRERGVASPLRAVFETSLLENMREIRSLTEAFSAGRCFSCVSLGEGESLSEPVCEAKVGDLFPPSCDDLMDDGFEL
jgi:hypothetical protein